MRRKKTKRNKLNLPIIMDFDDYHEINHLQDQLKPIIAGIKCEELSYIGGKYFGIFYLKKDSKFKSLVKSHNLYFEEAEDYGY